MSKVLVFLAEGFEEIETVAVVDVLRRAGVEVVLAGLDGAGPVRGARGVSILADLALEVASAAGPCDFLYLPGGRGGADRLIADVRVHALVREQFAAGRCVAAICAAPEALLAAGVLAGRRITSHPSSRDKLVRGGVDYCEERVVWDGTLLTSRAPGTAIELAYAMVERLCGAAKVEELNAGVLARL